MTNASGAAIPAGPGFDTMNGGPAPGNWAKRLRDFARGARAQEEEKCELCSAPIPFGHSHLAEPSDHRLLCVCQGCDMLLGDRADRKYVRVPQDAELIEDFHIHDAEWDSLGIPIGLAFFFRSSPENRILAFYPGPAGPTESLLDLGESLQPIADNPLFEALERDVEALLVNRVGEEPQYYRAPIDRCYELVGLIRAKWKGVSGGTEAWDAIDGFFAGLCDPRREGRRHG